MPARFRRNVAPGVHRLEHAYVNCYLIDDESGVTIVDAALPSTWPLIQRALRAIGRSQADVRGLLLTHAHFDHLGFARRMKDEWDVPVLSHRLESWLAAHPYRYEHERARSFYPLRHPKSIPVLVAMARAGALRVPAVTGLETLGIGEELDLPGRPVATFTPGHTYGHCAVHLPDRNVLLTGDALVTLDPYTGAHGPQVVSGAAAADSAQALASLSRLEETGAHILLPGHGPPWRDGVSSAVALAREAGAS